MSDTPAWTYRGEPQPEPLAYLHQRLFELEMRVAKERNKTLAPVTDNRTGAEILNELEARVAK